MNDVTREIYCRVLNLIFDEKNILEKDGYERVIRLKVNECPEFISDRFETYVYYKDGNMVILNGALDNGFVIKVKVKSPKQMCVEVFNDGNNIEVRIGIIHTVIFDMENRKALLKDIDCEIREIEDVEVIEIKKE